MERIETEFKNLPTHKISYQNNENANPKQAKYMPITDNALAEVDKHRNQVNASQREKPSSHNGSVSWRQTSQPLTHTYVVDPPRKDENSQCAQAHRLSKSPADMSRHPPTNYSDTEMPAWARLFLIQMEHQMNQNLKEIKLMNTTLCDEMRLMNRTLREEMKPNNVELKPSYARLENKMEQNLDKLDKYLDETSEQNKEEKLYEEENTNKDIIKNTEQINCDNPNFNLTTTRLNLKRPKKKYIPKKKKEEKTRERKKKKKKKSATTIPRRDKRKKRKTRTADATSDATKKRPVSHPRVRNRNPTWRPERMSHFILVEQDFLRHQGKWSPWVEETTQNLVVTFSK